MSEPQRVWSKFTATNTTGDVLNLQIVEMPEDLAEDVIELFINHFVKEEYTFKAAGVYKNVEAIEEIRIPILKAAKEKEIHIIICCLGDKDGKIDNIIGASMMVLEIKDEKEAEFHPETREMIKLFEIFNGMASHYDEKKELNLDRSFVDRGVFVHPDFRGLGIAQEFFKVRRLICKEHGIPIHGAWMTSYGTQKAAERDGWETVCEVFYDSFGKSHGVTFEDGPPSCKFMIARIS